MYESVVRVRVEDPPAKRRRDIEEGIGYACALLADEYGATAVEIEHVLENAIDAAHDYEANRA